jgi:hypothetical protein
MKTPDPWQQYRKPSGEFRFWLHEFWWVPEITATVPNSGIIHVTLDLQSNSLPWIFPRSPHIDGSELEAFYHMGYFKNAPEPWPQWIRYADSETSSFVNQSIYGVVLDCHKPAALRNWLAAAERQCEATGKSFKAHVLDKHVLFSATTGDRDNANT